MPAIRVPVLCVNGTRDDLCRRELMEEVPGRVGSNWRMHWLEGADHSFHVLKSSGRTDAEVLAEIGETAREWIGGLGIRRGKIREVRLRGLQGEFAAERRHPVGRAPAVVHFARVRQEPSAQADIAVSMPRIHSPWWILGSGVKPILLTGGRKRGSGERIEFSASIGVAPGSV